MFVVHPLKGGIGAKNLKVSNPIPLNFYPEINAALTELKIKLFCFYTLT